MLEARQQLAEERFELHPREVRAEAEVDADAEREVLVGVLAVDVEAERIREDAVVAVGGEVRELGASRRRGAPRRRGDSPLAPGA